MPKNPSVDDHPSHADPPANTPDISPLAIILEAMRERYKTKDYDAAIALARIAAPYLHPRVTPRTQAADLAALPDADLDAIPTHD